LIWVKLNCLNASHEFEQVASGGKVCETTHQLNLISLPDKGSIPVDNRVNETYQVTNGGPKSSCNVIYDRTAGSSKGREP